MKQIHDIDICDLKEENLARAFCSFVHYYGLVDVP